MELSNWFLLLIAIQLIHGLGTWKLYQKAGRKSWEAFVPIYNAIVLMKIINRPVSWTLLLFFPVINLILIPVIWIETLRSFGKNSTNDTFFGILSCGLYIYYINYFQPDVVYIKDRSLIAKTKTGDTISSLLFAIVVATLVHTYVMQPFTIPTASLEKSLLIGDFLFVSKFHYGARTPMTAVAAPMVHDTLPLVKTKSYTSWPQLPYFRFPGFQKIKKNDIVVFNWPADTVYKFFDTSGRSILKPVDKKSNYVKLQKHSKSEIDLSIKHRFTMTEKIFIKKSIHTITNIFESMCFIRQVNVNKINFRYLENMDSSHYFGTTRMSAKKRFGVTNLKSLVYGTKNVYCSGTSVLPLSSPNHPTWLAAVFATIMCDSIIEENKKIVI